MRKSNSFSSMISGKNEIFLPVTTKTSSRFRLRQILGHCLYRRVVIWALLIIVLLSLTFFNPQFSQRTPKDVLGLVQMGKDQAPAQGQVEVVPVPKTEDAIPEKQEGTAEADKQDQAEAQPEKEAEKEAEKEEEKEEEEEKKDEGPHWLKYTQYVPSLRVQAETHLLTFATVLMATTMA